MPASPYPVADGFPGRSASALVRAHVGLRGEMNLLGQSARSPAGSWLYSTWQAHDSLVVPRKLTLQAGFPHACGVMDRLGWPVVERESGGGVTPLSPGVLNLSIAMRPIIRDGGSLRIEQGYRFLCRLLEDAVTALGLAQVAVGAVAGAFCDGRYNLTVDGLKVAGTAQRWRTLPAPKNSTAVLVHAAIIVDAEVMRLSNAVNHFYDACATEKKCDAQSHTSLNLSLMRQGQSRNLTVDDVVAALRAACNKLPDSVVW